MVFLFAKSVGMSKEEMDLFTVGQIIDLKIEDYNLHNRDDEEDGFYTDENGDMVRKATAEEWANL